LIKSFNDTPSQRENVLEGNYQIVEITEIIIGNMEENER
jgi:hypothetical protein